MLPNKPFIHKPFPIQLLHIKHQLQTKISPIAKWLYTLLRSYKFKIKRLADSRKCTELAATYFLVQGNIILISK